MSKHRRRIVVVAEHKPDCRGVVAIDFRGDRITATCRLCGPLRILYTTRDKGRP